MNEEDPLYLQLPFETDETWFQLWIDQNYAQDEHTGINAGALYRAPIRRGRYLIQLVVRDQLLRNPGRGLFLDISALAQWTQNCRSRRRRTFRFTARRLRCSGGSGQRLLTTVPMTLLAAEIDGPAAVTVSDVIELPLVREPMKSSLFSVPAD
ncbi:MAG: hypothetical protein ACLVJ6_12760 [Merdibacter sp.]